MSQRTRARLWVAARLLRPSVWLARKPPISCQRILVLHHLLLGDTLMLTPLLAKLRQRWPQAELYMSCAPALLPLYASQPFGVQTLAFNPKQASTLKDLARHGPFDLCVVPAENRFVPLARAVGAQWVCGFDADRPGWKNWLLDEAHAFPATPSCFGDFAATLIDGPAPAPYQGQDWPWASSKPFTAPPTPYAVLHLGASSALKFWPAARWQALAEWLNAQGITPVWSAGTKETALVAQVDPTRRYPSYAGQLDLLQMAHLLKQARLMVCPDTGVAHLGRLTDTPTVTLFGPGSPEICGAGDYWRNSPFVALSAAMSCRDQHHTFRRKAIWIQRCSRSLGDGPRQCPQARCMEAISLDQVQAACTKLLQA